MKRKLILNLAMSLDGYIANTDGGFDWIHGDGDKTCDTPNTFDFSKFSEGVDTVIMGRKAFDDIPDEGFAMFEGKNVYVATSRPLQTERMEVVCISGYLCTQVQELQKKEGKDIWLYCGAGVADAFIKANIVDEYIVGIIPIVLGEGRPLFLEKNPTIPLHLTECSVQEGIVIMRYINRGVAE